MDKKAIEKAIEILEARADFWYNDKNYDKAGAYDSAAVIVKYALEGKLDCLSQFDYSRKG